MLNFESFKTEVKNQARDILVYEVYYYDDNEVITNNFKKEINKYFEIFWSAYTINCHITIDQKNVINCKIYVEDVQCEFQFCLPIDTYKRLRLGVG